MINRINFHSKVDIGVVRIFSGVHFFVKKLTTFFKVDYILEFLNKKLCLRFLRCPLTERG